VRFLAGVIVGSLAAVVSLWAVDRARIRRPATSLGHMAYKVADPARVVPVDDKGEVLMMPRAARAFKALREAALADGIQLVALSGYRTLKKQRDLFFDGAAQKGETVRARARVCAPPGYSEHHTGYSVDVGDAAHVDSKLVLTFRDTPAFRWLAANAARFHFEMSFPHGNKQGVEYEPWHWRYVGSIDSFRTFFPARRAQGLTVEASIFGPLR
jgi:D-alanyl-D-alanine carboxypeptidase